MRPKVTARSPSKEYYQIWAATSSENAKETESCDSNDKEPAPPLPPRTLHRPLERSHALNNGFKPPVVPREHKPKVVRKPEDAFEFDLIDTDETDKSLSPQVSETDRKLKAALIENGRRLIGSDNYVTTVLSKNLDLEIRNSSPHAPLEGKDSQTSISTYSSSSVETMDNDPGSSHLLLKPHKPLARQISPSRKNEPPQVPVDECSSKQVLQERSSSSSDTTTDEITDREAAALRPHPRALARIANMSSNLPVCPPTPTHHAKRSKNADLKPPSLKCKMPKPEELTASPQHVSRNGSESPRLGLIALSELRTVENRSPEVDRENVQSEGEASGGIPLPLRHITTTRLPSIPERTTRILAMPEIPGECEEPLPPSKYKLIWRERFL